MGSPNNAHPGRPGAWTSLLGRRTRGALVLALGAIAITAAFVAGPMAMFLAGLLLIACGVLEVLEVFTAADDAGRASAYVSGGLSVAAGAVLLARPELLLRGLAMVMAASFALDGVNKVLAGLRLRASDTPRLRLLFGGLVNLALAAVLATGWPVSGQSVVVVLAGLRMLTQGWSMLLGREVEAAVSDEPAPATHPDCGLGLAPHPEFARLEESLRAQDERWRAADAYWFLTLVVVFFA